MPNAHPNKLARDGRASLRLASLVFISSLALLALLSLSQHRDSAPLGKIAAGAMDTNSVHGTSFARQPMLFG